HKPNTAIWTLRAHALAVERYRRLIVEQSLDGFAEPSVPFHPSLVVALSSDGRRHQQRARDVIDTPHYLLVSHVDELEPRALGFKSPTLQRDRCAAGASAVAMGCRPRGLPGPSGVTIQSEA